MKVTSTFKQLEHTPALDQKILETTDRLKKYFHSGDVHAHWTCWVTKEGRHIAELKVNAHSYAYFAESSSDVLYKSIDLTLEKIERQWLKEKGKMKRQAQKKHRHSLRDIHIAEGVKDEEFWEDHDWKEWADDEKSVA